MNIKQIERMWKICSKDPHHDFNWHDPTVVAFAALVSAAEREACAKVCEDSVEYAGDTLAEAIRARGQE